MNLFIVQTLKDGSKARQIKYYDTRNGALGAFFSELSYAAASDDIVGIMVELIDDSGYVEKCERFTKQIETAPYEPVESEE